MYTKVHDWFPFYTVLIAVICVMFVYLVLIMVSICINNWQPIFIC